MQADLCIPRNLGTTDRVVRTVAGAALVAWAAQGRRPALTGALAAAIGGTQIHTGASGY